MAQEEEARLYLAGCTRFPRELRLRLYEFERVGDEPFDGAGRCARNERRARWRFSLSSDIVPYSSVVS